MDSEELNLGAACGDVAPMVGEVELSVREYLERQRQSQRLMMGRHDRPGRHVAIETFRGESEKERAWELSRRESGP